MRAQVVLVLIVAACTQRGRVDVVAYSKRDPGTIANGARIIFTDVDGSTSESKTVNAAGRASGDLEDGGTVWMFEGKETVAPAYITAFTDVSIGSTLQFGKPIAGDYAPVATMQLVATLPAGAEGVRVVSRCSGPMMDSTITFDSRCDTTADIGVLATHFGSETMGASVLVKYAYFPAHPIVDGGTLTVGDADWQMPAHVAIDFSNATGTVDYTVSSSLTDLKDFTGGIALVGPMIVAGSDGPDNGGLSQLSPFAVTLPPSPTAAIDLDTILPPTATVSGPPSSLKWRADASARRIDAVVVESGWIYAPLPGFEIQVLSRIISPAASEGVVELPHLPSELDTWAPPDDAYRLFGGYGSLVRFEGFDDSGPQLVELTEWRAGNPSSISGIGNGLRGTVNHSVGTIQLTPPL